MPQHVADSLVGLLDYDEETAGGVMTTSMLVLDGDATVAEARTQLKDRSESSDVDGVLVVDADGVLVDNVRIVELFTAEPEQLLRELTGAPWPITVAADVMLEEVIEAFVENRGSSLVVVDEDQRPIGRILADDLVDALLPEGARGLRAFAGLLS
jgi:Mg/Co/Ni transporter MgtE